MFATQTNAYADASIMTASPERLLVMLVDRLVLDIQRGAQAFAAGNREEKNAQLTHAQDIVFELRSSLKVELCPDGENLAAVYDFLHSLLIKANVSKTGAELKDCYRLATMIADTWRSAAMAAVGQ